MADRPHIGSTEWLQEVDTHLGRITEQLKDMDVRAQPQQHRQQMKLMELQNYGMSKEAFYVI